MNDFTIDIETIPRQGLSEDMKPQFDRFSVKLGNLKDAGKIADKISNEKAKFESGLTKAMSVKSDYCQIVSLGYIETDPAGKEISRGCFFDAKDDLSIIERFIGIYDNQRIIGWNSKAFDIPVIRKRAILNNFKNPFTNYHSIISRYKNDSIDLMHEWNGNGTYDFYKMSKCAKILGIECKDGMDGSMIYDAWKNKEYEPIKAYNISDCECTLAIYKRLYL